MIALLPLVLRHRLQSPCRILLGDNRETLRTVADKSVQMVVTSPPYFGLRDYGHPGQMGLEATPEAFVAELVGLFREVRRVLKDDGTVWLNLGDSYCATPKGNPGVRGNINGGKRDTPETDSGAAAMNKSKLPGLKQKDLIGIPWRVAFALQADGWYLRQDIIWHKPNPMPESVRDRCTKAHEYIFLLSKSEKYYFDSNAMQEPAVGGAPGNTKPVKGAEEDPIKMRTRVGLLAAAAKARAAVANGEPLMRNRRSVWTVTTKPYKGAHFATFPPALVEPCILAGSKPGDTVLDPFGGSGTTGQVALQHGRRALLCELNPEYVPLIQQRISKDSI